MRAHIVLDADLIDAIDRIAGKRKRSAFIEDAIREKLVHERQRRALEKYAGILDLKDHPEWSTPEAISRWVREGRNLDEERLKRKLKRLTG